MKNTEKKELREMIEKLNGFKTSIEEMSENVVDRCFNAREIDDNSPKIDKFEEEENSLDSVAIDIEELIDNIQFIIDGVGY